MRPISLRVRLVTSYVVLGLLLLSFAGYIFYNALSGYAALVQRSQATTIIKQAVALLKDASERGASPEDTLELLRRNLPDLRVEQVVLPVEKTKALAPILETAPKPLKPVWVYSPMPVGDTSFTLPRGPAFPSIQYRFTVRPSAVTVLMSLYRQVLIILVLAIAMAGLIGWLFSNWMSRPLSRLASATEAVAGGDFRQRVECTGVLEVDRLVDQFNRMALRLRESFESLAAERDAVRRFAADAAHELKTPVATLRAYHEMITERPERLGQVTSAVERQVERIEQVVSGLLKMATLGSGEVELQPVDLREALVEMEPVYQALAEESGHRLATDLPDGRVPVRLNRRLLTLALDNLMDNACKYMPPGGQVRLAMRASGTEAVIQVEDTGPGIPPGELPHVFERFHRGVDTQSIPGTGLGLAIARESVRLMGGDVEAESELGRGSRFSIRLPLA